MAEVWPHRNEWFQTSTYTRVTWKAPENTDYRHWPPSESSVAGYGSTHSWTLMLLVSPHLDKGFLRQRWFMVTDGEMTRAGILCLTCSGPNPICCHGDRQAFLPPVCGVAVGHTVTQQPSWSSSQTLASWLRASLGPGYPPECCPSSRVRKLPIGTAELCPGFLCFQGCVRP